jgi:hypothetical protein
LIVTDTPETAALVDEARRWLETFDGKARSGTLIAQLCDEVERLREELDTARAISDGFVKEWDAAEAEVAELRAALGEIVAKAKEDWAEDPFDSSVVAWGIETTPDEFPALYTFLATTLREGKA